VWWYNTVTRKKKGKVKVTVDVSKEKDNRRLMPQGLHNFEWGQRRAIDVIWREVGSKKGENVWGGRKLLKSR